jgi:putative aldouronate transport system permease protein
LPSLENQRVDRLAGGSRSLPRPLARPKSAFRLFVRDVIRDYQLYLLLLPAVVYILVFHYWPMYGVQIAFKDFRASLGIWGSEWVGFRHFVRFFQSPNFLQLIRNTLGLSVYSLVAGFPIPIILAILLNEVRSTALKKTVQTTIYAPHFISTVVMAGMIVMFLNHDKGIINHLVALLGGDRADYMTQPKWFPTIYVFSGIWQNAGWGTIIYFAALSTIDPQVVEAAMIDGASRLQKIWHIDLPGIAPTITILLIMNLGGLLSVGFEKVLLLQNALNMETADVISTYVYRVGLLGAQFSYSSAIGLFNSVINFVLLLAANGLARRSGQTSLW